MGKYSNEPLTDARIKRSHDKWVTNEDEWQRRVHEEDDEENEENEQTPEPPKRDAWYIEIERQRQFINPAMDIHEQL